ncbi:MAG: prolyl oligopeptidase family serine peptidase [Actinomycetales bacterium]|nr:prolyl oligopeptidase family serine peptidase [Actinomycetales bacterium]
MQPPLARRNDSADPYAWLRHPSPEVTDYLAAERAYYDDRTGTLAQTTASVLAELRARTPDTERSVPWDHGSYAYYSVTPSGRELPELRRRSNGAEQTLLDMAAFGSTYAAAGVIEPSPDDSLLAYSVDQTGAEIYSLRFRDTVTGEDLPVEVAQTYYTGAWSADGRWFFYTVPDHLNRPCEIWRVDVRTGEKHLVLSELDQRFELVVARSRSGDHIVITAQSRSTTEVWALPADDPSAPPVSLRGRTPGMEYRAEHDGERDRWLVITNDGHEEFAVIADDGFTISNVGERIHDVLAFTDCLVTEQRVDGECRIRVVEPDGAVRFEITPDEPGGSLRLGHNEDSRAPFVTVATQSFTTPTTWWDVDLRTGERTLRHHREAPGHDPTAYVSEVVHATAADGWQIPVVVTRRRDTSLDGTAPCLLYGYGSYESVDDPWFDASLLPLLDRGVVFAKAHIRGGGEVSRRQWIDGHLMAKRNTFTDFISAADHLADGLVDGYRIVSRGLSAGGLLQGAVYFLAPERWAGVIAEVPFVDVVNSMLDTEIPLTITEWEEWGNPAIPEQRAYMESYAPYANLPDPERRPALLVTGAVHDPRVLVHEPAKWVAALRHSDPQHGDRRAPTDRGSVVFKVELGEGSHGGQVARYAALAEEAQVISWALAVLQSPTLVG